MSICGNSRNEEGGLRDYNLPPCEDENSRGITPQLSTSVSSKAICDICLGWWYRRVVDWSFSGILHKRGRDPFDDWFDIRKNSPGY